ncbi:nuclear transport factor 2 family protein [Microbacterium caowuchunii]|nr:nuclear transport factor 2 family protein [Microbacterium caowuchunii]
MDSLRPHPPTGIEKLEYELIVRDLVNVLNAGAFAELSSFLHEDVVYRSSGRHAVRGASGVVTLCQDIATTFHGVCIEILSVAVDDNVVLVEEWMRLGLPGEQPRWVMGFASYRMRGLLVAEWRRMHA